VWCPDSRCGARIVARVVLGEEFSKLHGELVCTMCDVCRFGRAACRVRWLGVDGNFEGVEKFVVAIVLGVTGFVVAIQTRRLTSGYRSELWCTANARESESHGCS
jgi:hypothetical protein